VGRSCILISIGGKNVMLDCGMHMGFNDEVKIGTSDTNQMTKINLLFLFSSGGFQTSLISLLKGH
jgi:Cft2 family RNA processing exonuclease